MDFPKLDLLGVINTLLPGFLAAWIYYGLTAHPKQSPFERVVQALIFTGVIQAIVFLVGRFFGVLGLLFSFGTWTTDVAFFWSIVFAILTGVAFAVCANNDYLHRFLRRQFGDTLIVTKRTSFPSEWFSAFNLNKRYVVLHLRNGRRIYGWPLEWPDSSDSGHFVLMQAAWMLPDNTLAQLHTVERILIAAVDVEMVEFIALQSNITTDQDTIREVERRLLELQDSTDDESGIES